MPGLLIITGWRGVGKTTLCRLLAETVSGWGDFPQPEKGRNNRSWQVAGLLSPAVIVKGEKVAIDAVNLRSGEKRRLATHTAIPHQGTAMLDWAFDPAVLDWGNQVLRQAVPCDLLIVDELGPLELLHKGGWQAGVEALNSGLFRMGIVVIRPEFMDLPATSEGGGSPLRDWKQAEIIQVEAVEQVANLATRIIEHLES